MAPLWPADSVPMKSIRKPSTLSGLAPRHDEAQPTAYTENPSEIGPQTHGFLRVSAMHLSYAENGCHTYAR
jgi:hypothetical protein